MQHFDIEQLNLSGFKNIHFYFDCLFKIKNKMNSFTEFVQ